MSIPQADNLYAALPQTLPQELVTILAANRHVRIERIVSTGHTTPAGQWYDQDEHEWVVVLQGAARLRFADCEQPVPLQAGDHVLIPAHRQHRVEWTSSNGPTVWLAVFFGKEPQERAAGHPSAAKVQ